MAATPILKSPYPYFGGKAPVAAEIWRRLGDPKIYVEPFFGSGAVWLARPTVDPDRHLERVNDLHGFIPNFWRAVQHDPEQVARWATNPAFECDLHARHLWIVNHTGGLSERLMADPDYYDAKIAGWWVWGISWWIGSGWCSGEGGWIAHEGRLVRRETLSGAGESVSKKRPHSTNAGRGINRRLPHANLGQGINRQNTDLIAYFEALQQRMHRGVWAACGDWRRVLKPAVAWGLNDNNPELTGIVLDPPYVHAGRDTRVYQNDHPHLAGEVRQWAIENGDNPNLRIAYCGYSEPDTDAAFAAAGWAVHAWKTQGGYGNNRRNEKNENKHRERVWFSPHCVRVDRMKQRSLFEEEG